MTTAPEGEGAQAGDLSVTDAVATIDRVSAYEGPLRRRTEGVTWIVWGLTTALFFATQAALREVVSWEYWLLIGLPAWLGVGVLGAQLVWRIASLTRGALAPDAGKVALAFVVGGVAFILAMVVVYPFSEPHHLPQAAVAMVFPWAFLGAVQWARLTPEGRRVTVVLAFVMPVLGLVLLGALGSFGEAPVSTIIAALVAGGLPFALGTAWTLRG